jgi:hypothetical protein
MAGYLRIGIACSHQAGSERAGILVLMNNRINVLFIRGIVIPKEPGIVIGTVELL